MTKPPNSSPFFSQTYGEDKLAKMRENAMEQEIKRYIRLEAREQLKQTIREAAQVAGHDVDDLINSQPVAVSIVDSVAAAPGQFFRLLVFAFIIGLPSWFIYLMLTGAKP